MLLALAGAVLLLDAPAAQAAGPPQVEATWTTNVAATSATLHAQVNPDGATTTVRFEYLTEAAYQANHESFAGATLTSATGLSGQLASRQVSTLSPNTTYRYRAVAISSEAPGGVDGEPNFFTSEETAAIFSLPDHRGWEMVSPVNKNGGAVQGPGANFGGDVLQAAAGGGEATYSSASSFAGGQGAPAASQYMAGREALGWSTANVTAPQSSGAEPEEGAGVPYRLFSEDLASALIFSGGDCLAPGEGCANPSPPLSGSGAPAGYQNYYLRNDATGAYQALIAAADAPELHNLSPEAFEVRLAGATPDLRHVVLSTCAKLTPEATEQPVCGSGGPNLYEWSEGTLRLINLLGSDTHGTSDAHLAAQSGAISSDGSRVYFTLGEEAFLYLREGEAGAKPVSAEPAVQFQTASADGSVAFYTKGEELFRYSAQSETSEQIATAVKGVLGASAGRLPPLLRDRLGPLPLAQRHYDQGRRPGRSGQLRRRPTTGTARVSSDGSHLLFSSSAKLTGFDNTDSGTGKPDSELYLYDAQSKQLACVSCNPTNERPDGSASVPGAIANGSLATQVYKPRVLSADSNRVFFDTEDSLALQDTNNRPDVYEWEAPGTGTCGQGTAVNGGCVSPISSGRDGEASEFIDASAEGTDAFFLTAASLVPSDPGSYDLYDAREGGGFPVPPTPIPCEGDACQPLPSEPEDPTPGTLVPGEGNPPVHFPKTSCGKSQVRKHGKCVKKPGHKKKSHRRGGRR